MAKLAKINDIGKISKIDKNANIKNLRKSLPQKIIKGKTDFLENTKYIAILEICYFWSVRPALSKRKIQNIYLYKNA